MFCTLRKKNSIKNVLKWLFSGFSFFFIAMLFFVVVHDAFTGEFFTNMPSTVPSMDF